MEKGLQTNVVMVDFAKAFGKVSQSFYPQAWPLQHETLRGQTNAWILSFLKNWCHTVVEKGAKSEYINMKSGVPQGSVLGLCTHINPFNDLPDRVTSWAVIWQWHNALQDGGIPARPQEPTARPQLFFCGLKKGFTPKICMLCFVLINSIYMCLDLVLEC